MTAAGAVRRWRRKSIWVSFSPIMDGSAWIVIGLFAGAIAKMLMPGRDPGGCLVTIMLGIGGAVLAGFLGQKLG